MWGVLLPYLLNRPRITPTVNPNLPRKLAQEVKLLNYAIQKTQCQISAGTVTNLRNFFVIFIRDNALNLTTITSYNIRSEYDLKICDDGTTQMPLF
jgi:hypothetical protein